MNKKYCRRCPHLDFNAMTDEMYCKLRDYELIRLRWHKQRPDWCPLITGQKRELMSDDTISRQAAIDALDNEYRCTDQSDDWDGLKTAMLIIEKLPSA